jgi:hypothetical protein
MTAALWNTFRSSAFGPIKLKARAWELFVRVAVTIVVSGSKFLPANRSLAGVRYA